MLVKISLDITLFSVSIKNHVHSSLLLSNKYGIPEVYSISIETITSAVCSVSNLYCCMLISFYVGLKCL